MRKVEFILAVVLMLGTTAWGEVLITGVNQMDDANAVISFVNTEGQHVRGFALDIMVHGGAVITAVECLSADYYVYPGSIEISDNTVTNPGSCVCDAGEYDDTLGGLDTNAVTIEMAALYSPNDPEHPNAPADSGDLLKITLSGNDTQTVCIRANGLRGGVVMEDVTSVEPNAPCFELDFINCCCMNDSHPDFIEWVNVGEPNCWCYPRQCHGDLDGKMQYSLYWVFTDDLDIFKAAFAQTGVSTEPNICADTAHDEQYSLYRVFTNDLDIFKTYFANSSVPCCDQNQDCDTGNDPWFNLWTSSP